VAVLLEEHLPHRVGEIYQIGFDLDMYI